MKGEEWREREEGRGMEGEGWREGWEEGREEELGIEGFFHSVNVCSFAAGVYVRGPHFLSKASH